MRKAFLISGVNLLLLSAPLLLTSQQAVRPQPREVARVQFTDVAAQSGITFRHENGASDEKQMFETFGSGVGVIDFDNDGNPDLFFANGADLAHGRKSPGNVLYRNLGNGKFEGVTAKAGVAGNGIFATGTTVGNYDNDGYLDIYVTGYGGNQLFHNNGDGTFTDITAKAGLAGASLDGKKMWSVGAGWVDYNNDGKLDLFVVNYCKWEVNKDPVCYLKDGVRGFCHPRLYAPLHNTLYRNNGDGTFTDVSEETGIAHLFGKGMSVTFADYDGDGYMDAFVTNDTTPNFLLHNLHGKKFEEVGVQAGVAYSADGAALSSMGADFRDVNNDGLPDIWYTAVEREGFPLNINSGKGEFVDMTVADGLAKTSDMSGWGNGLADFDNDGWKDLFVARANVMDNIAEANPARRYGEPNTIFRNLGNGKFQDVSATAGPDFQREAAHRGVAFGDLFNEGRIDMVVSVLNGPAELFHNISETGNHWILLKLSGTKSNRMAIGAQIKLTAADGSVQWNEVTTAVGYASSSDPRVHFGLGKNKRIREIEIRWPSGIRQVLADQDVDRILAIEEPAK